MIRVILVALLMAPLCLFAALLLLAVDTFSRLRPKPRPSAFVAVPPWLVPVRRQLWIASPRPDRLWAVELTRSVGMSRNYFIGD